MKLRTSPSPLLLPFSDRVEMFFMPGHYDTDPDHDVAEPFTTATPPSSCSQGCTENISPLSRLESTQSLDEHPAKKPLQSHNTMQLSQTLCSISHALIHHSQSSLSLSVSAVLSSLLEPYLPWICIQRCFNLPPSFKRHT